MSVEKHTQNLSDKQKIENDIHDTGIQDRDGVLDVDVWQIDDTVTVDIEAQYGVGYLEVINVLEKYGSLQYVNTWETDRHPGFDVDIGVELDN
jgi:hypothetical protein